MKKQNEKEYLLPVGNDDAERLTILNEIYNPSTIHFLRTVGLQKCHSVLDVGCGIGLMTSKIAELVNEQCEITGVDSSVEQIEVAINNNKKHSNIKFKVSSINELLELNQKFDLIYCRFLLVHLEAPEKALDIMRKCLKPNGILVCEEFLGGEHFCDPPSQACDQSVALTKQLTERFFSGFIGERLYSLFNKSNLDVFEVNVNQVSLLTPRHKMIVPMHLKAVRNAMISANLIHEDALNSLIKQLEEEAKGKALWVASKTIQIAGRDICE